MIRVTVLVPVLGRPERALPLVKSLMASVSGPIFSANVMFLCSPDDRAQEDACARTHAWTYTVPWSPGRGDYAKKINYGALMATDADFVLLGADDLSFHPGWLEAAMVKQLQTGACVIGTNDLANPSVRNGTHATHPLVHRAYAECGTIDEPGKLLHEGYDHQWVDNEFIETARFRGTFVAAADSHVEHFHPIWGTAEMDATYEKALRHGAADKRLYESRRQLWS